MNKDKFLAKYNDVLSNYNDLAACVRRQLNYNYPYKPCLDDKNEIFCEDVIDVYTYHHEQLQPWPYGELVRADVSPCRYDGAYMIAMVYQRDSDGKQIYLLYPRDKYHNKYYYKDYDRDWNYYYTVTWFDIKDGEYVFDPEVLDSCRYLDDSCGYEDEDYSYNWVDYYSNFLLKPNDILDDKLMDKYYRCYFKW